MRQAPNDYLKTYISRVQDLRFEDLPAEVVRFSKSNLLDIIGCTVRASTEASIRILADYVKSFGGGSESTILVMGNKVPTPLAVLVNCTMANTLEFDDADPGHPGAVTVPTALSVGEREELDGKQLLTAIAIGYEFQSRIFSSFNRRPATAMPVGPGVIHTFTATFTAGKLLKLGNEDFLNAVENCTVTPFTPMQSYITGGMVKSFIIGWPAFAGVFAAFMAHKGFTGTRNLLDGKLGLFKCLTDKHDLSQLVEKTNTWLSLRRFTRKAYDCCSLHIAPLEAALALVEEHRIDVSDIVDITILAATFTFTIGTQQEPRNKESARFSLPYVLAVSLINKRGIGAEETIDELFKDEEVLKLSRRIHVKFDERLDEIEQRQGVHHAIVKIRTKSGKTFSKKSVSTDVTGGPKRPMTQEETEKKFRTLSLKIYSNRRTDKIIDMANSVENHTISELVDLLTC